LPDQRVLRVQGLASSSLFDKNDPQSPVNRRISIIVMNQDAEDRFFGKVPAPAVDMSDDVPEGAPAPSISLPFSR